MRYQSVEIVVGSFSRFLSKLLFLLSLVVVSGFCAVVPGRSAELRSVTTCRMVVQVAAGDVQPPGRQAVTGETPAYVDCQTNIMRLTKQVAQIVQEMVSLCAARVDSYF